MSFANSNLNTNLETITEKQEVKKRGTNSPLAKPFLKWAGGKNQLLGALTKRTPLNFNSYHEPFIGGGAFFFALQANGLLGKSYISDINQEIINCYTGIRDFHEKVISSLSEHIYEKEYFYKIRKLDRSPNFKSLKIEEKISRTIYLNKSCFNGLYRVNSKGQFNTPFGRYSNPKILDKENLSACSIALKNTNIKCCSFLEKDKELNKNDFIYLDPPYIPLSKSSSFTSYAAGGFGDDMQIKLRDFCKELNLGGIKFLLSNSSNERAKELYRDFLIEEIQAKRSINSSSKKRGELSEILVRNYE